MNFRALLLEIQCPQNFGDMHKDSPTDRQTDRCFLKMVKLCSGHAKTSKSIENRMTKILANPVLRRKFNSRVP